MFAEWRWLIAFFAYAFIVQLERKAMSADSLVVNTFQFLCHVELFNDRKSKGKLITFIFLYYAMLVRSYEFWFGIKWQCNKWQYVLPLLCLWCSDPFSRPDRYLIVGSNKSGTCQLFKTKKIKIKSLDNIFRMYVSSSPLVKKIHFKSCRFCLSVCHFRKSKYWCILATGFIIQSYIHSN